MELQTKVPLTHLNLVLDYRSEVLLLGSCFSNNMGQKLAYHQFKTLCNPFGIIFHPIPLAALLKQIVLQEPFTKDALFFYQEQWHSYLFHSNLSHPNPEVVLDKANAALKHTHTFLKSATHVFLTLGTAWGYILKGVVNKQSNAPYWVANCHKQPPSLFKKVLVNSNEISKALEEIHEALIVINANIQLVLTVSPIRHLKDGFVENNRSKAHLIAGVHHFITAVNNSKKVTYFPAYEIQMDELRDYRFYNPDLIHPNEMAIDYIWERLVKNCVSKPTLAVLEKVVKIQKGRAHKPFHETAMAHQKFIQKLQKEAAALQALYPHMF